MAREAAYVSFCRKLGEWESSTIPVQVSLRRGWADTFNADTHHSPSFVPSRIGYHKFTQRAIWLYYNTSGNRPPAGCQISIWLLWLSRVNAIIYFYFSSNNVQNL